MGNRHRAGNPRAAVDALEDFFGRVDRVRRGAQHPGLRGRHRAARRAAGAEPRRGRARDPLRPRGRRQHQPALDIRAQELFLSRPAQGLPDQPVRAADRRGRHADDPGRRRRKDRAPDARASGRRRRQIAARGFPRHDRHRSEPRRHAAAGNRHRARHALAPRKRWPTPRRCTRWCAGSTSATATCRKARSAATPTCRCVRAGRASSARAAKSRTSTRSVSWSRRSSSRCGARSR